MKYYRRTYAISVSTQVSVWLYTTKMYLFSSYSDYKLHCYALVYIISK